MGGVKWPRSRSPSSPNSSRSARSRGISLEGRAGSCLVQWMDRHRTIQPQALRAHLGTHAPAGVSWALPLAYCSGWLGRDRSQHSQLANASRLTYLTCLRVGKCNRKRTLPMRLRNHFTTNTDGGSDALPRSTRRSFLRYLGVGT